MKQRKKTKKKGRLTTILLICVFLVGLGVLLYPSFSDYWNKFHQSRAIMSYAETVSGLSDEEYDILWNQAADFNARRLQSGTYQLTEAEKAEYAQVLNISENGMMGFIDIPSIDCHVPIYHGTDENVLQTAIGHLDWTSLPIGGEGTHTVLSGHRGLPSARLFTDLDRLVVGDLFTLSILDEVLTYEVDQILIVLPEEVGDLSPVPGMDYCTLVTCTPYGINTHRLLVRGHRVATAETNTVRVSADGVQIQPVIVAPAIGVPLVVVMLAVSFVGDRRQRKANAILRGKDPS